MLRSGIALFRSFAILAVLALNLGACAVGSGGYSWGGDVTIAPGWDRIGAAALKAAKDPHVWAPLLGAAALQIGNADKDIAEWANKNSPVFGSREAAADGSDWLRRASIAVYIGTGLAAPVADGDDWVAVKAQGFALGGVTIAATNGATYLAKDIAGRRRPLGQSNTSFPSGHASTAAVSTRLSRETLRYYELSPGARLAANTGLASLALMTGWARVESGWHYPADVLVGYALGNFFAIFAAEAFLHPVSGRAVSLGVSPYRGGWALRAFFPF